MTDAFLLVMLLLLRGNARAKFLRRIGLANAGNVVLFAFDRHQANAPDRLEIDEPAAMAHLALRQIVTHEHRVDRLQIIFGGQIHHRHVFIIEIPVLLGRVAVAAHEVLEHIDMRGEVAIEIHRHEAGKLQETGINAASHAGIGERHLVDAILAEPGGAALLGKLIDRGRAAARVDWAAHQRH